MQNKKQWWKILIICIACFLTAIILLLGSYVLYISIQYYRIEDNYSITINNNINQKLSINQNLSITTYNIGFGAYTHDFSFFMDYGETVDGKQLIGKNSVAKNLDTVKNNTSGAINIIKDLQPDFAFFQEVDINGDRSHHYNQYQYIQNSFTEYSNSISLNFHSAYLFYPILEPHGKTEAGIVSLSKYNITEAKRISLPIDESFPTKFFDLDRCIQINRLPIESSDKELVLINVHLSAYDQGGIIRKQQLDKLNTILQEEKSKGNYIIAGGDFNHDIANTISIWPTNRKTPNWVFQLDDSNLTAGFKFVASNNTPTCRTTDDIYIKNESYVVTIDGFICSDNIHINSINNIDTDFLYSDHNPVHMSFKLM